MAVGERPETSPETTLGAASVPKSTPIREGRRPTLLWKYIVEDG